MDPPPLPPPITAVESHTYSLPPLPNSKLRLMCSYGGHIVPRPNNKSLCYAGGDTRIVAVDRRTTASTLSSLTTHLSRTLYNNRPFTLKYQLPNEELDSLISVTTDEDLQNMLEELDRVATSPVPSRIRLFLFPSRPESVGSVLLDPKSESWFSDALKSTMIINRGMSAEAGMVGGLMGLDCMGNPDEDSNNSGGGEGKQLGGCDSGSVPESMVLETCSSFGSTSSSISMSNLPPIGVHSEDGGGVNLLDKKVKIASAGSIESDNGVANAVSYPKTGTCQNQVPQSTMPVTNISPNTLDLESIIYDPSSTIQMQKILRVSGHQLPHLPEQKHQQEMQYVHSGPHYIQQFPAGPYPISSYYPMYRPCQPSPSQPYPIYLMPVRPPTQSYMSGQFETSDNSAGSLSRPPLHPQSVMMNPHVGYKEVMVSQPTPELAPELYKMTPPTTLMNQQQFVASEIHQSSQSVAMASTANVSYDNEYDNDLAYAQIYKSQPSAPALLPKTQTVMKASATILSSDASVQLHTDSSKQQVGTSQPQ